MFAGVSEAYQYDGSFDGFLSCVFEGFLRKERPAEIAPFDTPTLYPVRYVATKDDKAARVLAGLNRRISGEAAQLVQLGFLTCEPERELMLFDFICKAFAVGPGITALLADDTVHRVLMAVQFMQREVHNMLQFTRFSEQNGTLAAVISPKSHVLFLMREHFCARLNNERFLIYDKTHREALVYEPFRSVIVPMERFILPEPDKKEREYRRLWKRFYEAIAIKERMNPRCRMTHCPKRYWENMTELKEELTGRVPGYEEENLVQQGTALMHRENYGA